MHAQARTLLLLGRLCSDLLTRAALPLPAGGGCLRREHGHDALRGVTALQSAWL